MHSSACRKASTGRAPSPRRAGSVQHVPRAGSCDRAARPVGAAAELPSAGSILKSVAEAELDAEQYDRESAARRRPLRRPLLAVATRKAPLPGFSTHWDVCQVRCGAT